MCGAWSWQVETIAGGSWEFRVQEHQKFWKCKLINGGTARRKIVEFEVGKFQENGGEN